MTRTNHASHLPYLEARIESLRQLPVDNDPWMIVNDPMLDRGAKLERLRQLALDVRLALVATEEGMDGFAHLPELEDVHAAIAELEPSGHVTPITSPTKL